MDAIRTHKSNFTFTGPTPEISDLPTELHGREAVYSVWKFTDEERAAIANGAQVKLGIFQVPMPPVSLSVVAEQEVVGDGEVRCEVCGALWSKERAVKVCGHCGCEL